MLITAGEVQSKFLELFGREPLVVRSPGRINLIGEHTDYNGGFVMPAAIDREIFFAIAGAPGGSSEFYSINYHERFAADPGDLHPVRKPAWANFLLGVLHQFRENGLEIKPFYCAFGGNIPLGAGMSSSAAMECGFAYALSEFNLLNVPRLKIVEMAQWAEHNYAGVKCGIMDQYASVMGRKDHVIVLDCQSVTHRYAPLLLRHHEIILCDTQVKHSLVDSEYNARRRECETGVGVLRRYYPQVRSLRDVSVAMLDEHKNELPGKVYQRCLYVVGEIARVQEASDDLDNGRLEAFGRKMFETHEGLASLYEVSCDELDFLVDVAAACRGTLGARMMGGGFGGCTINLVASEYAEEFIAQAQARYREQFGRDLPIHRVNLVDGTARVPDESLSLWT